MMRKRYKRKLITEKYVKFDVDCFLMEKMNELENRVGWNAFLTIDEIFVSREIYNILISSRLFYNNYTLQIEIESMDYNVLLYRGTKISCNINNDFEEVNFSYTITNSLF